MSTHHRNRAHKIKINFFPQLTNRAPRVMVAQESHIAN